MNKISRWLAAAAATTLALGLAACSGDAEAAPNGGSDAPVTVKVATLGLISDGALLLGIE